MTHTPVYINRLDGAMTRSNQSMKTLVLPHVSMSLGGGTFISCEGSTHPKLRKIDLVYGGDFIQSISGSLTIYSTRVQYDAFYPTVTLRFESCTNLQTEFKKRYQQFTSGALVPFRDRYFTLHAYASDDNSQLFQVYRVNTFELVNYIMNDGAFTKKINPEEGNIFLAVKVSDLRSAGIQVDSFTFNSFAAYQAHLTQTAIKTALDAIRSKDRN